MLHSETEKRIQSILRQMMKHVLAPDNDAVSFIVRATTEKLIKEKRVNFAIMDEAEKGHYTP